MTAGEIAQTLHVLVTGFLCVEVYFSHVRHSNLLGVLRRDLTSILKALSFVANNSRKSMKMEQLADGVIMVKIDE